MRTYKVRKYANGKNKQDEPFLNYSITIPGHVAEKLPGDMHYECVLTENGILFRPASVEVDEVELPEWAKPSKNGN